MQSSIFLYEKRRSALAILQSTMHVDWAWRYGSSLKGDLRYTPRDVVETFPFPDVSKPHLSDLAWSAKHTTNTAASSCWPARNLHHLQPLPRSGRARRGHRPAVRAARRDGPGRGHGLRLGRSDLGHGFHETAQGVRFTIDEDARGIPRPAVGAEPSAVCGGGGGGGGTVRNGVARGRWHVAGPRRSENRGYLSKDRGMIYRYELLS